MRFFTADRLARIALAALTFLVLWKVSLPVLFPMPARLDEAFPDSRSSPSDSARFVLLVDAVREPREAVSTDVRQLAPTRPVEVRRLQWAAASRGKGTPGDRRIASLVRGFGYSRLPLLITFDGAGHVVRITALPER